MIRKLIPFMLVAALVVAGCGSGGDSHPGQPASANTPTQSSANGGAAAGGGADVGNSSGGTSTGQTHFAKTKFVIHAGLAFGAFHRWIYKPFRAGTLQHPLLHKIAFAKALLAGAFVVHEVRIALNDAKSSKVLSKVVAPLTAMGASAAAIRAALTKHTVDANAINSANSSAASASSASSAAGQPIQETTSGAPI